MLEIHHALRDRGAAVRVATHGGTYEWMLRDAGVAYDVLGPGMPPQRCAAFVRSVPGIAPPDADMWSDAELRSYATGRRSTSGGMEWARRSRAGR